MRLSKVNLIKKGSRGNLTPRGTSGSYASAEKVIIGAFWYIRDELDDDQARKLARSKQIDGYRGDIFYGSAEKLWKKTFAKRELGRGSYIHAQNSPRGTNVMNDIFSGRSYGLLSDDEDEDEYADEDIQDRSPNNTQSDQTSFHRSYLSSSTQQDLLSPPLSPLPLNPSGSSTPVQASRDGIESTPPMPGSFIFEDEAPASPTFSAGLTEPMQSISDVLYSTPSRPFYINPGLALESRFDTSSPVPMHSRFDMTPRQLAAFSRRRQDIEKLLERPTTPSLASDAGVDDLALSEKEKAERERRRKDLLKFRLDRQRRLRLENGSGKDEGTEVTKKRTREDYEEVDTEMDLGESATKKSRSSEIFARALSTEEKLPRTGLAIDGVGSDDIETHADESPAKSPAFSNVASPSPSDEKEIPSPPTSADQSNSYSAPTPSPSPPLRPGNSALKNQQLHQPKVPSNLRNATNFASSPATSPLKGSQQLKPAALPGSNKDSVDQMKAVVDSIPRSSFLTFDFPPLRPSFVAQISPSVLNELARYF